MMMIMPVHTESNNKIESYEYREQDKRGRRYLKEDKYSSRQEGFRQIGGRGNHYHFFTDRE